MIKRIVFIIFIFLIKTGFSQTLSADLKLPETVESGKEFTIQITVNKSDIQGFMKFSQTLPQNYSASKIDTKGGAFTFADNMIKIIWLSPPVENAYTFSYKIRIPENSSGNFNFVAKIDYLVGTKHETFPLPNTILKITGPAAKIPPHQEVIKEDKPVVVTPTKVKAVKPAADDIAYSVQIGAYVSKPKLQGIKGLSTFKLDNGVTKYLTGNFKTYEEAVKRREEMKIQGFKDAYIVTIKNGKILE